MSKDHTTRRLVAFVIAPLTWLFSLLVASAAAGQTPIRSLRVELPGQERNAIKESWPGIGCWFWTAEEFQPEGYKRFLDLHEKHSAFRLLTTSIRHPVEVTDPKVHDQIKAAAQYARQHDMAIVMDLDVRLARQAFQNKYPDELQEIVRMRQVALAEAGEAGLAIEPINLGDHYTFRARGYDSVSARVLRVYSYIAGAQGVEPDTVQDITGRCKVAQADAKGVRVVIPCTAEDRGRTACVLAAYMLFTPDVFAPHLAEFERNILQQYADVPLAGACKDEWGFPGRFGPRMDDLYFSRFMAEAYARRRPGRDLVRDMLLMVKGEKDRAGERAAAINHYMEMNWQRNGELETAFYHAIKEILGREAMSATHPTWYAFPCQEEVFKNGLDWWVVRRDLAQTDEACPFSVRTALAKKWRSPLWYNMYYDSSVRPYEEDIWRHALGGGRINFHPLWPHPWEKLTTSLLSGRLLAADCRVRLLNYISTAPIDCPVAVVFGHPSALNWPGPGFADVGLAVANGLWAEGYYADLIPSSEIVSGALQVAEDGRIQYGPQKYAAAVLYHPQFERPLVGEFFRKASAAGKTALFYTGNWTTDFEGKPFAGNGALPAGMRASDPAGCVRVVIEHLKSEGHEPQTTCTTRGATGGAAGFPGSMMPKPSGQCRLLDGTVILASGEQDVMGDSIRKTIKVGGQDVAFDAVGVAAVRLDKAGKIEALAAGALRSFRGGGLEIELPERADLAMWRAEHGQWHGFLQDWTGPIPAVLSNITSDWRRLAVPTPLPAEATKLVRLVLPPQPGPVVENIGRVLSRQIQERCEAKVITNGDAPLTVELAVKPGLGAEGFRIEDRSGGGVRIVGNEERGLLYGAGKFLRTSRYDQGGFTAGAWRGTSVPQKPVRGIYFATHFHNFYHDAPVEKVQQYVEDLGLWGYNAIAFWYDMHHFDGVDDPTAVAFRARLHAICTTAKNIGLDVVPGVIANEAYNDSPAQLRADPSAKRGGWYDCAVCPSKPGGMEYILGVLGGEFDWCADLQPRYVWIWPYDQGGCGCAQCRPWGSNGFLKAAESVAALARKKLPGAKIILSTWFFDEGEWQGLEKAFAARPPWADYILAEGTTRPMPGRLPLVGFPEISMHETFPWGGFGATPLTGRAQQQWNGVKSHSSGGFPYSEGIYEDITKAVLSQLYWNNRPAGETLREYAAFEYSPEAVGEIVKVVATLEQNHHWRWWPGELEGVKLDLDWFPSRGALPQADTGAEEAYATVKQVDAKLSPQARRSWRWRVLYLRALLDAELKANGGKPNERCQEAFAELIKIYHAEHANPAVRPPLS